jgi:hypothetical protein
MRTAVDEICQTGLQLLEVHSASNERSAHVADQWKLKDRLDDERRALGDAFRSLHRMLETIDDTRTLMKQEGSDESQLRQSMADCATVIESQLPPLQRTFLTIRHCALDLLRWARRFAPIEGSELPDQYRASYSRLLAYTPLFRPWLETMQRDLLLQSRDSPVSAEVQTMITALEHYMSAVESARAFVNSVVSPPMELVFHDTESFQADWKLLDASEQARLGTELNDCCQFLLYDSASFDRSVKNIQQRLAGGIDASMYVLPVEDWRIIFTMDEDPMFGQLIVTLLRVVRPDDLEQAIASLIQLLYRDLASDCGPSSPGASDL